ncbi:hypothetical protein JMJ35_002558 [Cladonia borealis]|uniref:Carbonic anhydrase n=1 Tax=Cladonia borealis TaxID=184061 RepID=A0AA39R7L7_9LECA|nr:hypothetical protein JMJ35_002558 [Cladonia borealis]
MATESKKVASWLTRNKEYAESYTAAPNWADFGKMVSDEGATMIVCCFDPRQNPTAFFGLKPGDAAILANAGGRINDNTLRSIECLDQLTAAKGGVTTIVVAHHTDCGMTHITDEEIKTKLKERAPEKARDIEGMEFGEITDLKKAVSEDMKILKASPYLSKSVKVLGFLFDIFDGTLEEIKL